MSGTRDLFERLQWFKVTPWALALLLVVNAGGIAYGFYYYTDSGQFGATPHWLWPLVPDSPMAVLWAFLALALHRAGRRVDAVDALAFVTNAQVGLWTAYVLLAYADHFRIFALNLNFWLFWLHLGMVALAALFVRDLRASFTERPRRRPLVLGGVLLWMLLHDAVDYFGFRGMYGTACGLRPITVPCVPGKEAVLAAVTFGLTLASVAALAWLTRPAPLQAEEARPLPLEAR